MGITIKHFVTREAGEQPAKYALRVGKLLEALEEAGIGWSEQPAMRGCYLLSVHPNTRGIPFAYLEYPK